MPVEVRELIIKTEIKTRTEPQRIGLDSQEIKALKQQIMNECLCLLKDKASRGSFNR